MKMMMRTRIQRLKMRLLKYRILVKKKSKVEVFIRDIDNKGDSAVQTFNIKSDKTINIPLKIKKGSDAGYTIRVDNKIVADKDVSYDG